MKKSLALLLVAALLLGVFALIGCNKPAGTDAQQLSVCLIVPYSFGDKSARTPSTVTIRPVKSIVRPSARNNSCFGIAVRCTRLITAATRIISSFGENGFTT